MPFTTSAAPQQRKPKNDVIWEGDFLNDMHITEVVGEFLANYADIYKPSDDPEEQVADLLAEYDQLNNFIIDKILQLATNEYSKRKLEKIFRIVQDLIEAVSTNL